MKRRRDRSSNILENDLEGFTGFEKMVYKAVRSIPSGETRSYGWVAGRIGRPRSSRAVGNALNKNPMIGIVPCHRVIRSDGSIGGFSKGVSRKIAILRREGLVFRRDSRRVLKKCKDRAAHTRG